MNVADVAAEDWAVTLQIHNPVSGLLLCCVFLYRGLHLLLCALSPASCCAQPPWGETCLPPPQWTRSIACGASLGTRR